MVKQKQSGFSTIEILIASSILVVVFSAVIMLVVGSQKLSVDSETAHEGQLLAQKYLEEGRSAVIADFNSNVYLDTTAVSTNTDSTSSLTYTIERRQVASECVKEIAVKVKWTLQGRAEQNVDLKTNITNPARVFATGSTCNVTIPPDTSWQVCNSDHTADIQPSGSQARDTDAFNVNGTKYLAIVAEHSDDTTEDFWIHTLNNSSIDFKSKLDVTLKEGLSAVAVARLTNGSWYAFVAKNNVQQSSDKDQLRVISLVDLASPVQVGKVTFNGNDDAKDVLYYNGFVYLTVGNVVHKIDISNIASPVSVASVNVGGSANKLKANGNYLYVATSDNNGELKIVNLGNMTIAGSYNAPGNEDGTAVYVLGNTVYLGRERSAGNSDLYVLNVSNPTAVAVLGSKNMNHTAQSYVVDIVVAGNLAFVGSTKEEFEVWNVKDPSNIFLQCSPGSTVAQEAAGLDLLDNAVYGAIRSNQAVRRFIDVNNPPQ